MIVTSRELWMQQAPSFNFELSEEELLFRALEVGYVKRVAKNLYEINDDYQGAPNEEA